MMKQQRVTKAAVTAIGVSVGAGLAAGAAAAGGTWEDERPVVQDPVRQDVTRVAAAPDDSLYVVWPDWTDFEDTAVTLTASHDRGTTWTKPAVLFDGAAYDDLALHADDAGRQWSGRTTAPGASTSSTREAPTADRPGPTTSSSTRRPTGPARGSWPTARACISSGACGGPAGGVPPSHSARSRSDKRGLAAHVVGRLTAAPGASSSSATPA